ncbi:hypothetical protein ACX0HA_00300 [Flavobacterium hauense]
MKKKLALLLFFFTGITFAQTVSEINTFIGIPDSLEYVSEMRIYKKYSTTNGTEIFRIYNNGKEYKAKFYRYFGMVASCVYERSFTETDLKGNLGNERAWMEISVSGIEHLPQWEMFEYKFQKPKIVFYEGCYAYQTTRTAVSDGVGYDIFYKSGKNRNHIEYGNPESYLERFPGVDELEMFSQMLNTVRKEFDIWKD